MSVPRHIPTALHGPECNVDETAHSQTQHIAKVAASCYYHVCHLRKIRRRVSSKVATRLVLALIMSRIEYCNSVLAGLPQSMIAPLQRVQNAAAHLVFELGTCEHVTASLLELQWLPVCCRVRFKLQEVFGLLVQHREACLPQSFTHWPTIFLNNKLCDAAATDKMWRARHISCWPSHVKRSTGGHA